MGEPDSKEMSPFLSWQWFTQCEAMDTVYDSPLHPLHLKFSYSRVLGTSKWLAIVADPKLQFSAKPKETHLCWRSIWKHICFRSTFWDTHEDDRRRPVALRLAGLWVWPMLSPLCSLISHQLRSLKVYPPAFKLMTSCFLSVWTSPGFTQDLLKGNIFLELIWHFDLIWDQTLPRKLAEMVFGTSPLEQGLFLWNSCFFLSSHFLFPLKPSHSLSFWTCQKTSL